MKRLLFLMLIFVMILVTACSKTTNQGHGEHKEHGEHSGHNQAAADTSKAIWKYTPTKPLATKDTNISVQIQDDKGKAVEKFDVNHEKLMHLIVVSKDLSYFDHIHPENKAAGHFDISTKFPAGGEYKLFADYVVTGSTATTKSSWVTVEGTTSAAVPIVPDKDLEKTIAGKEVTLSYDNLTAGKDVNLTFHIVDEKTKKPVTDLQPYLGAVGHVVILSADAENYLHVHPTDEMAKGPDAKFTTKFPKSGVYKIWGQFQQNGQTFIVPFVVNVP